MATVFAASKAVGAARDKLGIRKKNKVAPILRWIGVGVGIFLILLGVLAIFFPSNDKQIWGAVYAFIIAVMILIFQAEIPFVKKALGFLLETFYWRALIYIGASIPCFFHKVLIAGGVFLVLLAFGYVIAAFFFKEKEYLDKATIERRQQKVTARKDLDNQSQQLDSVL